MAKAWIVDQWLRKDAPASVKRRLNASRDPLKAKIPDQYKSVRYGQGKRWRVQWFETDANGKRRKASSSVETRADAERLVTRISSDQLTGRYVTVENRNRLYGEVWREWFDAQHHVKDRTGNRYEDDYDRYVKPRWANVQIGSIDAVAINAWVGQLRDGTAVHDFKTKHSKKPRKPKPLGASSIKGIVTVAFGATLGYAAKRHIIPFNPMDGVSLPKDNKPDDPVYLRHEEVEDLAGVCDSRNALIIRMLAYTGMRPNELFALHIDALDFERRRIRVVRNLTEDRKGHIVEGSPKTWETRTIAMPEDLIPALHAQCDGRPLEDYVFTSPRGKAVNLANWRNREWKKIVLGSGVDVEGLTVYSLRHTYASLAIAAGCDVKTLQKAMGHKDAAVTLNTYAALFPDRMDDVADAMAKARALALSAPHCTPMVEYPVR